MFRQLHPISAIKAGILGTFVMTILMYALPFIGLPPMDIMAALGSALPLKISPYIPGAIVHSAIGITLAIIYAAFFYSWLPGPTWLRGALFSLLPWLFAITLLGSSLQLASQVFGTASSAGANPCAPKAKNPCAPANPRAPQTANPCAAKPVNPCAATNPSAVKTQTANPCAPATANPCAAGAAPARGIPPQILSLVAHLIYGGIVGAFYRPRA